MSAIPSPIRIVLVAAVVVDVVLVVVREFVPSPLPRIYFLSVGSPVNR
jgi:hypothetical protein